MKFLLSRISRAYDKFKTYSYKLEDSPYYAAARIFDPSCRTTWLKGNDNQWIHNGEAKFRKVKALWDKFIREIPEIELRTTSIEGKKNHAKDVKIEELDAFQQLKLKQRNQQARPQSQDEFESYCSQTPSYDLEGISPITWWTLESQQTLWPRLSVLAINVLSIPGMSDKPERKFSGARRTISWERAAFNMDTVEMTECLKDWKTSGILLLEF
jgi:hAT family C-terminal dimerisation region